MLTCWKPSGSVASRSCEKVVLPVPGVPVTMMLGSGMVLEGTFRRRRWGRSGGARVKAGEGEGELGRVLKGMAVDSPSGWAEAGWSGRRAEFCLRLRFAPRSNPRPSSVPLRATARVELAPRAKAFVARERDQGPHRITPHPPYLAPDARARQNSISSAVPSPALGRSPPAPANASRSALTMRS